MSHRSSNVWTQHRRALSLGVASDGDANVDGTTAHTIDQDFLAFLAWHGLGPWWLDRIESTRIVELTTPAVIESLTSQRRAAMAAYMMQRGAIQELGAEFERRDIAYVVIKGGATREVAYDKPYLRVGSDVDVLLSPNNRERADAVLTELGYTLDAGSAASAHEATYVRGSAAVDLHWNILSPGRTRRNVTDELLSRRVRESYFWRLADDDTVLLMLAHPAFAKYVCSPHMGLNRVLDFGLFVETRAVAWAVVSSRLASMGLQTAAWCTLTWMQMIDRRAQQVPTTFLTAIAPSAGKQWYLQQWLDHDLPGRLADRADWLIRAAFTLPMHDTLRDAWRALAYRAGRRSPAQETVAPT